MTRSFLSRAIRYIRRNGSYWSARKAANYLLAAFAMRQQLEKNPAMPIMAKIEATNVCNGTCKLCPVAQKRRPSRKGGFIQWGLFTAIIDELKKTLVIADLTNWGESLLHSQIIEMVSYTHRAGIYTYLSTNLHTVKPEHIEQLVTCGLDELTLSLHGMDEQSYQGYQPGFSFAESKRLIHELIDARKKLGKNGKPKMTLNFVVTRLNVHQVDELREFAASIGVESSASRVSLNLRFDVDMETARNNPEKAREIISPLVETWLPEQKKYRGGIYDKVLENPAIIYDPVKMFSCDWPWKRAVFNYDGALSVCCGSYDPVEDFGRFEIGSSFKKIWNGEKYRMARRSFKMTGPDNSPQIICQRCPGLLL